LNGAKIYAFFVIVAARLRVVFSILSRNLKIYGRTIFITVIFVKFSRRTVFIKNIRKI